MYNLRNYTELFKFSKYIEGFIMFIKNVTTKKSVQIQFFPYEKQANINT